MRATWLVMVVVAGLAPLGSQAIDETPADAPEAFPRQTIEGNAGCLTLDRARDFKVINSQTVIVWRANRKDPHKISLFHGCPRLRSANAIYFDADGWDQVCGRGGEYLVIARPGIPRPPSRSTSRFPSGSRSFPQRPGLPMTDPDLIEDRCAVAAVETINDDVVHELLVQGGHAAPRGPEYPDRFEVMAAESDLDVDNKIDKK